MSIRYYQWFIWCLLAAIIVISAKGILLAPHDISTLTTNTFAGHEWQYNLYRLVAMADAFSEAMPGRWIENFSLGWGYPLFQFTGPLPYTLGACLLNIGFDPTASLNMSWLVAYIAAGLTMFFSCKPILGSWGALLATTCYLLAPYHLVDTYVRTNLVETTAFIFPPLVLGAIWRIQENPAKAILLGAIGIMFLPLTHMLSTYLIGLGFIVFTLLYLCLLPIKQRASTLRGAILLASFGLALSAFFWIPAIIDIGTVRGMGAITEGFYSYDKHFVYAQQLLSSEWHYGGSEEGPRDYMSFSLGKIIILTALVSVVISLTKLVRLKLICLKLSSDLKMPSNIQPFLALIVASGIAAIAMIYMTLDSSTWLWRILPGVDAVQFPWRFLFPACFFLAICAGSLPKLITIITPRYKLLAPVLASIVAISIIINHWDFARAGSYQSIDNIELTDSHHKRVGIWTTNNFEFMPEQVKTIPSVNDASLRFAQFYTDSIFPAERIAAASIGHGWAKILLFPGAAGELELRQHWHPAWRASIDGIEVDTFANSIHPLSPIRVEVPENAQEISFRYGYTMWGKMGLWLSLFALLLGIGLIYKYQQSNLLARCKFPALCFFAVLFFYYQAAKPDSSNSRERIADIELRVALSQVAEEKLSGSRWDASGNQIMPAQGLVVELGELKHQPTLSLSLDHNDRYLIGLLKEGEIIEHLYTDIVSGQGGIAIHQLTVSAASQKSGYDAIVVTPLGGDGYYSLGHLMLLEQEVKKPTSTATIENGRVHATLDSVSRFRPTGTPWNAQGNIVFTEQGLQIQFATVSHAKQLDISVDSNDLYMIYFFNDDQRLDGKTLFKPNRPKNGLIAQRLSIPESTYKNGFNRIALIPVQGDHYYSLGHLILLDD